MRTYIAAVRVTALPPPPVCEATTQHFAPPPRATKKGTGIITLSGFRLSIMFGFAIRTLFSVYSKNRKLVY